MNNPLGTGEGGDPGDNRSKKTKYLENVLAAAGHSPLFGNANTYTELTEAFLAPEIKTHITELILTEDEKLTETEAGLKHGVMKMMYSVNAKVQFMKKIYGTDIQSDDADGGLAGLTGIDDTELRLCQLIYFRVVDEFTGELRTMFDQDCDMPIPTNLLFLNPLQTDEE